MSVSRRSFLYGATAAAGAGALSLPAAARDEADAGSGLVTGKARELKYEELGGFLSKEQLRWHHDSHYGGALKGFVELDKNPAGDHRARIAKANSVLLHELYFDNMTATPGDPGEGTRASLKKRFGSLDRWLEDFGAAARSAQGWAVLAHHPVNGRLYNVVSDSHDDGPAWTGVPIVVVDTYEHAYYLDFKNRKADYVEGFLEHMDWGEIEGRLRAVR